MSKRAAKTPRGGWEAPRSRKALIWEGFLMVVRMEGVEEGGFFFSFFFSLSLFPPFFFSVFFSLFASCWKICKTTRRIRTWEHLGGGYWRGERRKRERLEQPGGLAQLAATPACPPAKVGELRLYIRWVGRGGGERGLQLGMMGWLVSGELQLIVSKDGLGEGRGGGCPAHRTRHHQTLLRQKQIWIHIFPKTHSSTRTTHRYSSVAAPRPPRSARPTASGSPARRSRPT